jgi:hypothetical protein
LVELLKEFAEKQQVRDTKFLQGNKFKRFIFDKSKELRRLWIPKHFEITQYLNELSEEDSVQEIITKFKLEDQKERDAKFEEIALAISVQEDFRNAPNVATKNNLIKEALYKAGISDFVVDDIMRIKGKADLKVSKSQQTL